MTASGIAYLDTSALVKLVRTEAESDALRIFVAATTRRLSSRIAQVELRRAVARVARPGDLDQVTAVLDGLQFVELDAGIGAAAAAVGPPTLKSLDAIHLASALVLGPELEAMVTYDRRLADAGRAAGLVVVAPD